MPPSATGEEYETDQGNEKDDGVDGRSATNDNVTTVPGGGLTPVPHPVNQMTSKKSKKGGGNELLQQ